MHVILSTILLAASLTPSKMWFANDQPITVDVKAGGAAQLVLTDFSGKVLEAAPVPGDKTVNVREAFQQVATPGTYVLYLTKTAAAGEDQDPSHAPSDFLGTPLVISVRQDRRPNSPQGPMVTRVEPLRFAVMSTPHGAMTMAFYYDSAPNTANNFLTLAEQGFYDGLTFHRIIPGFVLQGGDPKGNGTGGPGYSIPAEFSRRKHNAGVLSMARSGDPLESTGAMPRKDYADSASSQFFICLDYATTRSLDTKYTAFGEVVSGMDVAKKIAAVPLVDARRGEPTERQVIEKVEAKLVTAAENPYAAMFKPAELGAEPVDGSAVTPAPETPKEEPGEGL